MFSYQKNKNDHIHSIFFLLHVIPFDRADWKTTCKSDIVTLESYSGKGIATYVCDVIESTGEKLFTNIIEMHTNDNTSGEAELIPE